MRREICGECGAPINDEGACICTELLKRGWRLCAKGQQTTQWCATAEGIRDELREQRQRDETLLRQALEALGQIAADLPWKLTGLQADAIVALRERLGVSNG